MTAPRYATSLATPRRGIAAARTLYSSLSRCSNTERQLDASPKAPWTRMTVGLDMSFLWRRGLSVTACAHRSGIAPVVCPSLMPVSATRVSPGRDALAQPKPLPQCQPTGGPMVILRQKMRSKHDKIDEVTAALAAIIAPARATQGVMDLDIARDLLDPDSFIATAVYEDGAALERQESAAEVHRAMALFAEALQAPPDRTIFDASVDPTLV